MRAVCGFTLALLLVGCSVKPVRMLFQDGSLKHHDEPYPAAEDEMWHCLAGRMDVVEATVVFSQEGQTPLKTIHVHGYTEMPDGSDVIVSIRPVGNRLYKTWADVRSTDHNFAADLGPFTNLELPEGKYLVEVTWLTIRQEPHVRAAADVQDLNMKHRERDMDMDHRATKIVTVPTAVYAAPPAEHPQGEHPAGEHPQGQPAAAEAAKEGAPAEAKPAEPPGNGK